MRTKFTHELIEITIPGSEGQHAWLFIYVPDELEEQIDELISERVYDIFVQTGYDIAALVYEKSQLQASDSNEIEKAVS